VLPKPRPWTPLTCLNRSSCCSFFSALVIILANMLLDPDHALVALDLHLTEQGMDLWERLLPLHLGSDFPKLHVVVVELRTLALQAVDIVAREKEAVDVEAGGEFFMGLEFGGFEEEMDLFAEEPFGFPTEFNLA